MIAVVPIGPLKMRTTCFLIQYIVLEKDRVARPFSHTPCNCATDRTAGRRVILPIKMKHWMSETAVQKSQKTRVMSIVSYYLYLQFLLWMGNPVLKNFMKTHEL